MGVHAMLVQALQRFGSDALLTQQVCHSICEAANGNRAGAALLLKAHAPSAICAVMDSQPTKARDPAVLSSGISALRCLAANSSPQAVKAVGAEHVVRRAMQQYPRDKALERGGNDVLKLLGAPVAQSDGNDHSSIK